jgi:hypothetical protein
MADANENLRVMVTGDTVNGLGLVIWGPDGARRVDLLTTPEGEPSLVFYDENGNVVSSMKVPAQSAAPQGGETPQTGDQQQGGQGGEQAPPSAPSNPPKKPRQGN